jgi:hypothetical protein
MLRLQNNFLTNFRMIPVFGITPQALQHIFNTFEEDGTERQMTVQNFILTKDCIHGIETTNRAKDLGKLFLISDATGIIAARAFVDTVIKELFETPDAIPPELIHPNFNPPRRGDAPRTSATLQSYATSLANLGNPQDDATHIGGITPPPRPVKRRRWRQRKNTGETPKSTRTQWYVSTAVSCL